MIGKLATMGLYGAGIGGAYGGLKGLKDEELGAVGGAAYGALSGATVGAIAGIGIGRFYGRGLGAGFGHGRNIAEAAMNQGNVTEAMEAFGSSIKDKGFNYSLGAGIGSIGGYGRETVSQLYSKSKGFIADNKAARMADQARESASGNIPRSAKLGLIGTMALGTTVGGASILGAAALTGAISGDPRHPYNATRNAVRRNRGISPGQYGDTGDLVFAMNANRRGY